ncbi:hypothetical protein D9M72_314830 [compost metagenome]
MSRLFIWLTAIALAIGMSYDPDGPTTSDLQLVADDVLQAPIDARVAMKEPE